MRFKIQRYNPETDKKPYMQEFHLNDVEPGMMLRDALIKIKESDETLSFRHSCGEGVCGSDAININGKNGLGCLTPLSELKEPIEVRPVPGMPIIRDLVVDMTQFFHHYRAVKSCPVALNFYFVPEFICSYNPLCIWEVWVSAVKEVFSCQIAAQRS